MVGKNFGILARWVEPSASGKNVFLCWKAGKPARSAHWVEPSASGRIKKTYLTRANRLYAAKAFNLMDWNLSLIA